MKNFIQLLVLAGTLAAPAVFAQIPEIPFDSVPNFLKLPEHLYLGEAVGVATNSKGHVFVYTRTGSVSMTVGTSRPFLRGYARLFEFDQNGNYVKEWGQGVYGFTFAHAVRVDPQDNVWVIDEGSDMIMKFDPSGKFLMNIGRKPESVAVPRPEGIPAETQPDAFGRETDVAWDAAGNIFVSDGYANKRVAKFDKTGRFVKEAGKRGSGVGEYLDVHTIAVDHQGNVYVGDRTNKKIVVYDNDLNLKTEYKDQQSPWAICITPGAHQYLYSSNSSLNDIDEAGEIYKMELDGKILGKFGRAGKMLKEFDGIHEMDCRFENTLLVGEIANWRVQKLILHPDRAK